MAANSLALENLKKKVVNNGSQSNTQSIKNLSISSLDPNPENEQIFRMDGVDELAENIKDNFKGAIVVFDKGVIDGEHRYEIGSGHRRVEAMKLAGKKEIQAIVYPMPPEDEKFEFLIDSNLLNRQLTPLEYSVALARLRDRLTLKNQLLKENGEKPINVLDTIATKYRMARRMVMMYINLNKIIPELQKLVDDNVVPWTRISEVANWEESQQKKLYTIIKNYLKQNDDFEDDKTLKITTAVLKQLMAQVKDVEEKEEPGDVPKPVKVKKVDMGAYCKKLSSQMNKLYDMPMDEMDVPEDVTDIRNSIQSMREMLDKLEEKINEKA